jgi:hypothetical protein
MRGDIGQHGVRRRSGRPPRVRVDQVWCRLVVGRLTEAALIIRWLSRRTRRTGREPHQRQQTCCLSDRPGAIVCRAPRPLGIMPRTGGQARPGRRSPDCDHEHDQQDSALQLHIPRLR